MPGALPCPHHLTLDLVQWQLIRGVSRILAGMYVLNHPQKAFPDCVSFDTKVLHILVGHLKDVMESDTLFQEDVE